MVSDLLVLPPGVDLHDHPLVLDGSVFLQVGFYFASFLVLNLLSFIDSMYIFQGKASCMVANALSPKPGWKVCFCAFDTIYI